MKHLEPVAGPSEKRQKAAKSEKRFSGLSILLVGVLTIAASGFALSHWINPMPEDKLDAQEVQRLEAEFTRLRAVSLSRVEKLDEDSVLDTMRLDPSSRKQLKHVIGASTPTNETVLVRVSLWDFAAQDGDVVSLSSAGYAVTVPLVNGSVEVALPVDMTRQIAVTGLHDGGGGITLAITSGSKLVSMPVLAEGQTLSIPVEF